VIHGKSQEFMLDVYRISSTVHSPTTLNVCRNLVLPLINFFSETNSELFLPKRCNPEPETKEITFPFPCLSLFIFVTRKKKDFNIMKMDVNIFPHYFIQLDLLRLSKVVKDKLGKRRTNAKKNTPTISHPTATLLP
jgi:hypothetical protein